MDRAGNGPALMHRQALELRDGSARTARVLTHGMQVEVVDLQIQLAGEQTRQRRLSRLRTASDPEHVCQVRAHVLHEPRMMRRKRCEKQSSANAPRGAQ